MNKKKMILIGISVFVFIIIVCIVFLFLNRKSFSEQLKERVDNKEDILIYVTDKFENCYLCPDIEYVKDYYEEVYGLNFMIFDKEKESNREFNKILSVINYNDIEPQTPALFIIKNGQFQMLINQIATESFLKEKLLEYGFIDKRYADTDNLISLEKFNNFSNDDKVLLAIYTYFEETYDIRKSLIELSKSYDFKYYTVYSGVSDGALIADKLYEKLGNKFQVPSLIIYQNNKVVDYINSTDKNKIEKFLKKNNIIMIKK